MFKDDPSTRKDIFVTSFVITSMVGLFSAIHLSTKQPNPWKLVAAWLGFAAGLRIGNTPSLLLFLIPIILNIITK